MGADVSTLSSLEGLSCDSICVYVNSIGPFEDYRQKLSELNIDGRRLKEYIDMSDNFQSLFTNCSVVLEDHQRILRKTLTQLTTDECIHTFVEKWVEDVGIVYHCVDCKKAVTDVHRVQQEQLLEAATIVDNLPVNHGKLSQERGVTIRWLIEFTNQHNCWNIPTWKVRRMFVLPATAHARCRYVELPVMQQSGVVGVAATFVSHTWGATWGDLVSAVSDGADLDRRVWVDIFAVRQWPAPEEAQTLEMDFASTIKHCSSFMLVCSHLQEVCDLNAISLVSRDSERLTENTRKQLAFLRIWCLAELHAATNIERMPIVMKVGSLNLDASGLHSFVPNSTMCFHLAMLIDINKAEATVKSDGVRILAQVEQNGGVEALNRRARGIISGSSSSADRADVLCAACGDIGALDSLTEDFISSTKALKSAAGAGFVILCETLLKHEKTNLVLFEKCVQAVGYSTALQMACRGGHEACASLLIKEGAGANTSGCDDVTVLMEACHGGHEGCTSLLIMEGADVNVTDSHGCTALMHTCVGGHKACASLLIMEGANVHTRDDTGKSALIGACMGGHDDCARLLITKDVDVDAKDKNSVTALMIACTGGHFGCALMLVLEGADVNAQDNEGNTALLWACRLGHHLCVSLLIVHGVDVHAKDKNGFTAMRAACKNGHISCASLLLARIRQG